MKFDKEKAKKEAISEFKKYIDETIWTQALLEGETLKYGSVATYFDPLLPPKTQIDNIFTKEEKVTKYTINLLNCLKEGWDFIECKVNENKNALDIGDLIILNSKVSKCDGNLGGTRQTTVRIKGCSYIPETPVDAMVEKEKINEILYSDKSDLDKGIELFAYGCKRQMFNDGNKRTALLNANFYFITNGVAHQFFIKKDNLSEFRNILINYYEDENRKQDFVNFLKNKCISYTQEFRKTEEYKKLKKDEEYTKPEKYIVYKVNDIEMEAYDVEDFKASFENDEINNIEFIEKESDVELLEKCKNILEDLKEQKNNGPRR